MSLADEALMLCESFRYARNYHLRGSGSCFTTFSCEPLLAAAISTASDRKILTLDVRFADRSR